MAANIQMKINEVTMLQGELSAKKGNVKESDTVLADTILAAVLNGTDHTKARISSDIFGIYTTSTDKTSVEYMFEALAGIKLEDYLSKCEGIIRKQLELYETPVGKLVKTGFSKEEAEEIIATYGENPEIVDVYNSLVALGANAYEDITDIEKLSFKTLGEMANFLVKNSSNYLKLSTGRVIKVK